MSDDDPRNLGSLPGGPRRRPPGTEDGAPARPHRLTPVEELEDRVVRARQRHTARRRRRRVILGFVAAVLVAGAGGYFVGLQGRESAEELAARQEREARERARAEQGGDTERILEEIRRLEESGRAGSAGSGGPREPR